MTDANDSPQNFSEEKQLEKDLRTKNCHRKWKKWWTLRQLDCRDSGVESNPTNPIFLGFSVWVFSFDYRLFIEYGWIEKMKNQVPDPRKIGAFVHRSFVRIMDSWIQNLWFVFLVWAQIVNRNRFVSTFNSQKLMVNRKMGMSRFIFILLNKNLLMGKTQKLKVCLSNSNATPPLGLRKASALGPKSNVATTRVSTWCWCSHV